MGLMKDERLASKGNGYTLVVPGYNNPQLQKFYQEAKAFAGDAQGKIRMGKFVDFVHGKIDYDENWNEGKKEVSLIRSLYLRKGVCKEKAAILSMLLQMEGLENEFKRGTVPSENKRERHSWVKVKVDNENFLADPEQNLFGKYDSVLRHHDYRED